MDEKKDVQQRIFDSTAPSESVSEEEFLEVIRAVAPGSNLRSGLNGILRAGKGALIVIESNWLNPMIDGGFRINSRLTPQKLIELSKMDGAIVLSKDMKRIVLVNALLTPSSKTPTHETGTRHKAAERVARQAGTLSVAVSERRGEITLYYKNVRYHLMDSGELLRKANEQIQILEKQRELFDKYLKELDYFELRNFPSLAKAVEVIQRGKVVQKMAGELKKFVLELGKEGVLIRTRLKDITSGVEKETDLVVKDYTQTNLKKSKMFLDELSYEDLLNKENIFKSLDYESPVQKSPVAGWRILSKTSLAEPDIAVVIKEAGSLGKAIHSNKQFHETILGEEKSKLLREEIDNIKLNPNLDF